MPKEVVSVAMSAFCANVKRVIESSDKSLSDIARETGMSLSGLSRLLNGDGACTIPRAERIAISLGVPLEELLSKK